MDVTPLLAPHSITQNSFTPIKILFALFIHPIYHSFIHLFIHSTTISEGLLPASINLGT